VNTTDDTITARKRHLDRIDRLSLLEKETALAWLSGYAPDTFDQALKYVEGLRS
jgi:hypothetical protein